jgi:hypothetical protein
MARPDWEPADEKWFLAREAQNTGSIFANFKKVHKKLNHTLVLSPKYRKEK